MRLLPSLSGVGAVIRSLLVAWYLWLVGSHSQLLALPVEVLTHVAARRFTTRGVIAQFRWAVVAAIVAIYLYWSLRSITTNTDPLFRLTGAYGVLDVTTESSADTIRSSYRRLTRQFHPDKLQKLGETERKVAEEWFSLVKVAYETLRNPGFRQIYDGLGLVVTRGPPPKRSYLVQQVMTAFGKKALFYCNNGLYELIGMMWIENRRRNGAKLVIVAIFVLLDFYSACRQLPFWSLPAFQGSLIFQSMMNVSMLVAHVWNSGPVPTLG